MQSLNYIHWLRQRMVCDSTTVIAGLSYLLTMSLPKYGPTWTPLWLRSFLGKTRFPRSSTRLDLLGQEEEN
jgi:hypothetical protein